MCHRGFLHLSLCLVIALGAAAAACSDDDGGNGADAALHPDASHADASLPGDAQVGADSGADGSVPTGCDALHEGLNEGFLVDGLARSFVLNLPDGVETDGPWPVIFAWHGLGDTAQNFSFLLSPNVNGSYPFIGVTPEDNNFMMMGINAEWEVFMVTDPATNTEARLFDEVLACLEARYGVDEDRVHSLGFSNGSFVVNLLGVIRGAQIASLATYSGGYISNPENVAALGALSSQVSWPAPTHGNAYAELLLHGGTTDTYNMYVATLHFDQYAESDAGYLNGMGHDVVICNHGLGHTAPPPDMPGAKLIQFLADHPRGTHPSPYAAAGLPASFPQYCEFRGAE